MIPWGKYPVYKDIARFEYGRLLWKNPSVRQRMLAHWSDSKHPYHHRFLENQGTIEEVLGSLSSDEELDRDLRKRNLSLRAVVREIPPKFVNAKISE
jgi:hypothetical protein